MIHKCQFQASHTPTITIKENDIKQVANIVLYEALNQLITKNSALVIRVKCQQ